MCLIFVQHPPIRNIGEMSPHASPSTQDPTTTQFSDCQFILANPFLSHTLTLTNLKLGPAQPKLAIELLTKQKQGLVTNVCSYAEGTHLQ